MRQREEGRSGLGYLAALAAGVALGLIFAPRAGRDTRRRVGEWLDEHEGERGVIGRLARLRQPFRHTLTTATHNGKQLKSWS